MSGLWKIENCINIILYDMDNNILLSIVIPTKNRYKYLENLLTYLVEHVLNESVEIIVQDNTIDNSVFISNIIKYKDFNIEYYHDTRPMSMTENSDLAVGHSSGKYVCFIGDDDCVLSNIESYVKYADMNQIDAMVFPRLTYVWPDATPYINYLKTDEYLPSYTKKIEKIDAKSEFMAVLNIGGQDMLRMPKLYHGIISRKALDKVFEEYGSFFPGPSPDMANAIALSLLNTSSVYVDYPLIIAGTGYVRIKGNEKGDRQKLNNLSFLPSDIKENWIAKIPFIWTTPTIYAQTVLGLVNRKCSDYEALFNWNLFYATFVANNPGYFKEIIKNQGLIRCICSYIQGLYIKIKQYLYLNFKWLNLIRGYKKYDLSLSSAGDYALSVEKNLK